MRCFGIVCKVLFTSLAATFLVVSMSWRTGPGSATELVPAYFYPSGTGLGAWNRLTSDAGSIKIEAILNPASGPGATRDPKYVDAVNRLRTAGGHVLGYVATNYGNRDMTSVTKDIVTYRLFYNVDGIFIDEMANTQERLSYYERIYKYIKSVASDFKVIGNPGMPYTVEGYLGAADTLVIFEGSIALFADFRPLVTAPWVANYPRERFANIVYGATSETDLIRALDKAGQTRAGSVFITDGRLPNPYRGLPAYWAQEVATIRARDLTLASGKKRMPPYESGPRDDRDLKAHAPSGMSAPGAPLGIGSGEPITPPARRSRWR
jgi:Spherulation-specific family 4